MVTWLPKMESIYYCESQQFSLRDLSWEKGRRIKGLNRWKNLPIMYYLQLTLQTTHFVIMPIKFNPTYIHFHYTILFTFFMLSKSQEKSNSSQPQQTKHSRIISTHQPKYIPTRLQTQLSGQTQQEKFIKQKLFLTPHTNKGLYGRKRLHEKEEKNLNIYEQGIKKEDKQNLQNEQLVKRSIEYQILLREMEKEEESHEIEEIQLKKQINKKQKELALTLQRNKEIKEEIWELKYSLLNLKVVEKQEEEQNYRLFKRLESMIFGQKNEAEIFVSEDNQEEGYPEEELEKRFSASSGQEEPNQ